MTDRSGLAQLLGNLRAPSTFGAEARSALENDVGATATVFAGRRGDAEARTVVANGLHQHFVGRHALRDQRTRDRGGARLRALEVPHELALAIHAVGAA